MLNGTKIMDVNIEALFSVMKTKGLEVELAKMGNWIRIKIADSLVTSDSHIVNATFLKHAIDQPDLR